MEQNFIEVETCEQANAIDLRIWKFVTYDGGKYVFAISNPDCKIYERGN